MLDEHGVDYRYRDYRKEPLTAAEIRRTLGLLGVGASDVLRRHDRAYAELGLSGSESDDELISHMADHPTLLQRPIGVIEGRAIIGRPPANLLQLVADESK